MTYGGIGQVATDQESWAARKFHEYWGGVKAKISEIRDLGPAIDQQRARLEKVSRRALNPEIAARAKQALARNTGYKSTWVSVSNKIKSYLPTWLQAEQSATPLSGLGFIPLIIAIPAITALGFVAAYGLKLIKDVHTESKIIADLEKGLLTTSQATALLPQPTSLFSFGGGMSVALLLALGVGAYIFMRR